MQSAGFHRQLELVFTARTPGRSSPPSIGWFSPPCTLLGPRNSPFHKLFVFPFAFILLTPFHCSCFMQAKWAAAAVEAAAAAAVEAVGAAPAHTEHITCSVCRSVFQDPRV